MSIIIQKTKTSNEKSIDNKSGQSEIQCLARCYFNRIYKGECSCDLKTILIDDTGKCTNFLNRQEGIKLFHKENKYEKK